MKTHALLAAVLALTCACASSTSERPSTNDERQAAIHHDRDGRDNPDREDVRAETAQDVTERDAPRANHDHDHDHDRDQATQESDATEHEPDNTRRNERDDAPGNLTALDQSNETSDIDITQAIRKKVVADDALSFNAKNVKIITVSGKVTLRGPVASAQESTAIEQSARAVPGVVQVDNQIEVKR